jgi:hypothetical protein
MHRIWVLCLQRDDVVMAAFDLGRATEDWDELYDTLVRSALLSFGECD